MTQVLWPSPPKLYSDRFWPDRLPFSRRLRQIGQELFHLHQSNCHAGPVASGNDYNTARLSEDRNPVLKQSGQSEDLNVPNLHVSQAHDVCGKQDHDAVQQVVCDDEVVFKTSDNRKLPSRPENPKTSSSIPSTLARRALRHDFETRSPSVAPDMQDSSQHLVATSTAKPSVREIGSGSVHHKKQATARRSVVRKRSQPSAPSHDQPSFGHCDSGQVGIRTRRMSAVYDCDNQNSADDTAIVNTDVDNCSRLSSVSTAPAANLPTEVAVPTWRILCIPKRYVIEGTEDLTDEAYAKRHQRLEVDEKRRKRWDLQRQRELNAYEHLRRDDAHGSGPSTCPSRCSSPDIDDTTCIEVVDDVDARYAFGHRVPRLGQRDFELLWRECRVSSKRRRRNSTHWTHRRRRR